MKPGVWGESSVQRVLPRVNIGTFGNDSWHNADVSRTRSMYEGHPNPVSTEPYSTVSLTIQQEMPVTKRNRGPFRGASSFFQSGTRPTWPPLAGTPATVHLGDGETYWTHTNLAVERSDGTLSNTEITVELIDGIDNFDAPVLRPALLTEYPPYSPRYQNQPGQQVPNWRYLGLTTAFLIDTAFRDAGYFTTPDDLWESILVVSYVGSGNPQTGTVWASEGLRGPNYDLLIDKSARVPLAWSVNAEYLMTRGTDQPSVEFTVHPNEVYQANYTWVRVLDGDDYGFEVRYNQNNGYLSVVPIRAGVVDAPAGRSGIYISTTDEVRVRVDFTTDSSPEQVIRLRARPLGADFTYDATYTWALHRYAANWEATRTHVHVDVPISGLMVNHALPDTSGTLDFQPTATIDMRYEDSLEASRDIQWVDAVKVLNEIADATLGRWWIDEDGIARWKGRGAIENDPVVDTVTTLNSITDWTWKTDYSEWVKAIYIERQVPGITKRKWQGVGVWDGSGSQGYDSNSDVYEEFVSVPNDEDWIGVGDDIETILSGNTADRYTVRTGNVAGATVTDTSTEDQRWAIFEVDWRLYDLNMRTWKWEGAVNNLQSGHEVSLMIPEDATEVPRYWRGRNLPIMRGTARVTWYDETDDSPRMTGVDYGKHSYYHDVKWYVQRADQLTRIRDYLEDQLDGSWPVLDGVKVLADPRHQIGDMLTFTDPALTGVTITGYLARAKDDWTAGSATSDYTIRVTDISVSPELDDTDLPTWMQTANNWPYPD